MRKKILLLAVLVVASATTIDAQRKFPFFWKKKKAKTEQTTPAKKESEYDKLFKKKHETAKGLITLHLLDGKEGEQQACPVCGSYGIGADFIS